MTLESWDGLAHSILSVVSTAPMLHAQHFTACPHSIHRLVSFIAADGATTSPPQSSHSISSARTIIEFGMVMASALAV
jgi:hypothetical protein